MSKPNIDLDIDILSKDNLPWLDLGAINSSVDSPFKNDVPIYISLDIIIFYSLESTIEL